VAVLQLGRIHPDEVFQALEPATFRAFGYGTLAWEWEVGLRNWAVPGLFAILLRASAAVGIDHPQARRAVLELPQYALHVAMLLAAYRFSARRTGPARALWAIPLFGLTGLIIHFGGRTVTEAWSTAFLVWGLERLDAKQLNASALGGILLGCATVTRYGSLAPVAMAGVLLLAQRRWKDALAALVGGALVTITLGALDWATWGRPFHSLIEYVDFNVLSGKGAQQFGAHPVAFYAQFWLALVVWAWPGLVFGLDRRAFPTTGRAWWMLLPALAYLVAIFATPHKEARFLYPGLVLLEVAALPGWLWALGRLTPTFERVGVALSLVASLALVPWLQRYGSGDNTLSPQRPALFRLWVHAAEGATAVLQVNEGQWGAPGVFYFGRDIPWSFAYEPTEPEFQRAMKDTSVNRAVTYFGKALAELQAAGFVVKEVDDDATLLVRE
jgi:hypothetical protein